MQTPDQGTAPPPPPAAPPPAAPPPPPPPAAYGTPPPPASVAGPAPGMVYAGFWIRFGAYVIDAVIMTALYLAGVRLFVTRYVDEFGTTLSYSGAWWLYGGSLIIFVLYFGLTWPLMGGSAGQRLLSMQVLRESDGRRLTAGDSVLRLVGWVIAGIPICIGFIVAGFDPRKQGWHDKIAHTVVVRKTA
jgi:uncharacterized RDD family membrane protein YckC